MKNLLFCVLFLGGYFSQAQTTTPGWQWAVGAYSGSLGGSTQSTGIATDNAGNIYVTGMLAYEASFETQTLYGSLGPIFVAKYNASGALLWARQYGTDGVRSGSISIAGDGSIYFSGSFNKSFLMDSIVVQHGLSSADHGGFVAKLDATGSVVWVRSGLGKGLTNLNAPLMSVDPDNGLAIGYSGMDIDLGGQVFAGNAQLIVNYDALGNVKWCRQISFSSVPGLAIVKCTPDGNVFCSGNYSNSVTIDGVALPADGNAFTAKLNSKGDVVWVKTVKPLDNYWATRIMYLQNDGNDDVYILGSAVNAVDLGQVYAVPVQDTKFFIAKYNSAGDVAWAKCYGDADTLIKMDGLCVDRSHNIHVLTDNGSHVLVTKYSADGAPVLRSAGYSTSGAFGNGISSDGDNIITTGGFRAKVWFDYNVLEKPSIVPQLFLAKEADVTGIGKHQNSTGIQVYPNPCNDHFTMSNITAIGRVELSDMIGRNIINTTAVKETINTVALLPGTYTLKLFDRSGRQVLTQNIIKQ